MDPEFGATTAMYSSTTGYTYISNYTGTTLTDEDVKMLIAKLAKCKNASEFQELDAPVRNSCIQKLHKKGASIRQISRLTGISKKIVERNI